MTPAERTAKIAELRAEADRLEREGRFIDSILPPLTIDWCEEIWRKCEREITVGAAVKWVIEQDRARITIKTPDAPEPTGAELVGRLVDVSDAFIPYMPTESGKTMRGPVGTTGFYCQDYAPGEMAPYTLIHHNAPKSIFKARTVTLSKDRS